jgi:hypothetical protein
MRVGLLTVMHPLLRQGFVYINKDEAMVDPVSGNGALARNTNLNEDLGKVLSLCSRQNIGVPGMGCACAVAGGCCESRMGSAGTLH